jgi:hypothetical protein
LSFDVDYIDKLEFEKAYDLCDEISKTIFGLTKHLNTKN